MSKKVTPSPFSDAAATVVAATPVRPEDAVPPPSRVPLGNTPAYPTEPEPPSDLELAAARMLDTSVMPEPVSGEEHEDVMPGETDGPDPNAPQVTRATRQPLGSRKARLSASQRPGYYRYWFNDVGTRLMEAQAAGYTFVRDDKGQNVSRLGGTAEGKGFNVYLMELPMEWRNDDLAARERKAHELDRKLVEGEFNKEPGDGRYVPTEGINIGVMRGPGRG